MTDSLTREAHDAAQWWQAYCLAENDEAEEEEELFCRHLTRVGRAGRPIAGCPSALDKWWLAA